MAISIQCYIISRVIGMRPVKSHPEIPNHYLETQWYVNQKVITRGTNQFSIKSSNALENAQCSRKNGYMMKCLQQFKLIFVVDYPISCLSNC